MLPLFFQVVLLDSASQAGARLAIPSLATPLGALVAGHIMSRYGKLIALLRSGALCMVVGNALVTALQFNDTTWKYYLFIFPANFGQGITYPATLFTNIATFEHSGKRGIAPISISRPKSNNWLTLQITLCQRVPYISSEVSVQSGALPSPPRLYRHT